MTLSEILRQAFNTFRAHKMRTFLTMFGIVWGIASVIILVGLGRGFSALPSGDAAFILARFYKSPPAGPAATGLRDHV